jgi:endonuclease G
VDAIAFVLPNVRLKTSDLPKYLTSIDDIEALSNLDFLAVLSDGVESVVEGHVQPRLWEGPDDDRCRKLR